MNETKLRAALIEARDWFESQAKAVSKGCGSSYELHDLRVQRDALDAALATPAQAAALVTPSYDGFMAAVNEMDGLYAAPVLPPAPIAPVRQPLTVAQVQKIVITVCDSIYPQGNASYSEADSVFYGAFARAIEAEHGIK